MADEHTQDERPEIEATEVEAQRRRNALNEQPAEQPTGADEDAEVEAHRRRF